MCRGIERRKIFWDIKDRHYFLDLLAKYSGGGNVEIYAFALMDNHVHILIRTVKMPLSTFMRRLLTGYAVYFNRRHKRCGHLFQNRYKSFVVEEQVYLYELIRYIHLNPLRGGIIADLNMLSKWPFSGYAALMGNARLPWFKTGAILSYFASELSVARRRLAEFMYDGIAYGRRPELAGGGLKRSLAAAIAQAGREQIAHDERILGSGSFVEAVLHTVEKPTASINEKISLEKIIQVVANHYNLSIAEVCSGSKRTSVVKARYAAIWLSVKHLALSLTEISHAVGISPSSISGIISAGKGEKESAGIMLDPENC